MARRAGAALVGLAVLATLPACRSASAEVTTGGPPAVAARRGEWAARLEIDGLPNLHRVSPGLYRGAQPEARGYENLERLGVRTVLSLRGFHPDVRPAGSSLAFERIHFHAWHPEREDVVRFLEIVSDPVRQPVFVHCRQGADRTGMMCAVARIVLDGWDREAAIEEMTCGGYGFHPLWVNLVEFVRDLDVDGVRAELAARVAKESGPP